MFRTGILDINPHVLLYDLKICCFSLEYLWDRAWSSKRYATANPDQRSSRRYEPLTPGGQGGAA